jgi:hypothetical protein
MPGKERSADCSWGGLLPQFLHLHAGEQAAFAFKQGHLETLVPSLKQEGLVEPSFRFLPQLQPFSASFPRIRLDVSQSVVAKHI